MLIAAAADGDAALLIPGGVDVESICAADGRLSGFRLRGVMWSYFDECVRVIGGRGADGGRA